MIPVRLSFRYEVIPVPFCGSVFVYMTPIQNLVSVRVIPGGRVHPRVAVPGQNSHPGTKTFTGIM